MRCRVIQEYDPISVNLTLPSLRAKIRPKRAFGPESDAWWKRS